MCDPATLTALTIASTAIAVGGKVVSGVAQSQQATYQAQVADQNQRQANAAAQDALDRGKIAARNQQWRTAQIAGEQTAAAAANGIEVGFGSSGELAGDTAMIGSLDAMTIRQNSEREARGYSITAANYGSAAAADRSNASNAWVSTALDVGSTILGGASQVGKISMVNRSAGPLPNINSLMASNYASLKY